MQNKLAPIILFVYNRPWHTQQTLEALAKNELAKDSVLYIYADGAKENAIQQDLQKIQEVREIISTFEGCKETHIIERDKNLGLANNVIEGITKLVNQYGKIIVLEDDLITSPFFLDFMNQGLDLYEQEEKIYGITGYSFFPNDKLPPTFFLPIGSSWGWATWQRAWNDFEPNAEKLLQQIKSQKLEKKFNFGAYPYFEMLESQVQKKINSWAIRFYASYFLKKGLFLCPNQNLVYNIGMDASGTHCEEIMFDNPLKEYNKEKIVFSNQESKKAEKWVREMFENQFAKPKKKGLFSLFKF